MSRGRELFVWYRVADDRAEEARIAIEAMQRRLQATHPGLRARLLIRTDIGGSQTWMETYASSDGDITGIDETMQKRIEAAAAPLVRGLDGPRHAEAFDLVEPP